jgi:SAM-dependent methyltransferase
LADESVDVVLSNCVINDAADKLVVFKELWRCRRAGGRLVLSDLMADGEFSEAALNDEVWGKWLGTALGKLEYLRTIERAGFQNLVVIAEAAFPMAEQDQRLQGRIVTLAAKAYK